MKKTKTIIALIVVLCMIFAIVPFKAFANTDVALTVAYTDGTQHGKVEYCLNGTTWTQLNANFNGNVSVEDGQNLKVRIYVDNGYTVDWTTFTLNGAPATDNVKQAIMTGEGYQFDTTTAAVSIGNVAFNQAPTGTNTLSVAFGNGYTAESGKVQYSLDDGATWIDVTQNLNNKAINVTGNNLILKVVPSQGYSFDFGAAAYREDGGQPKLLGEAANGGIAGGLTGTNGYVVNNNVGSVILEGVRFEQNQQPPQNPPQPGNGGEQGGNNNQQGGPDDIEFDIEFTDTSVNVAINNKSVMDDADGSADKFNGTVKEAGLDGTNANDTNELRLTVSFGAYPISEYTINGVTYKEGDANVQVQEPDWIITVPAAKKYVIRAKGNTNAAVPRTIIWTNPGYVAKDAADAEWIKEFSLSHGAAYIKAVYDKDGNLVDPEEYLTSNWDKSEINRGVGKDNFGWVTIKPGSKVVFEFVPEYGYQLTDVKSNGQSLGVGEKTNQFVFVMPDTNIHFDAEFTKTDDIVKANSEKISSGEVSLGDNKLSGGTAQLTVNDVELSEEKTAEFEEAAGDYEISDYLNIDLYQVFYKGKNDANDVWSNKIEELDNEVKITLKLKEGMNAKDIVIVHNVHDGSKYEVIEIDSYDEETNTVTFRAKSFSNYAIATKEKSETETKETPTAGKNETSNPATGDNIIVYIVLFAIATLGVLVTFKLTKKNKNNKK